MEQMSVNELFSLCWEQIQQDNGKKKIVISDDNEGNGYHGLFFGFAEAEQAEADLLYDTQEKDINNILILG